MWHRDDPVVRNPEDVVQKPVAGVAHRDHLARPGRQPSQDPELVLIGIFQHRVQHRNQRDPRSVEQLEQHVAAAAAEKPVLVLEKDRVVMIRVQKPSRPLVRSRPLIDLEPDLRRIVVTSAIVERHHVHLPIAASPTKRPEHIPRERRDPARAGQVRSDQGDALKTAQVHRRPLGEPFG